jgi:hypothetical protein
MKYKRSYMINIVSILLVTGIIYGIYTLIRINIVNISFLLLRRSFGAINYLIILCLFVLALVSR